MIPLSVEPLYFLPRPGIADCPVGTENRESAWSLCPGGSREMMGGQEFPTSLPKGWSRMASYMHAQVDQDTGRLQGEREEQEGAHTSLFSEE